MLEIKGWKARGLEARNTRLEGSRLEGSRLEGSTHRILCEHWMLCRILQDPVSLYLGSYQIPFGILHVKILLRSYKILYRILAHLVQDPVKFLSGSYESRPFEDPAALGFGLIPPIIFRSKSLWYFINHP